MLLCYQKNTQKTTFLLALVLMCKINNCDREQFSREKKKLNMKKLVIFFSGVIFSLETVHPLSIYTKIETMRFIYYIFYTINCHNYHPHYIKSNHCLNFNNIMRWMSALKRPFLHKFTFFLFFFKLSQKCLDLFCSLYERSILV